MTECIRKEYGEATDEHFIALQYTLDMIGSKWRAKILYSIYSCGNSRFSDIGKSLPGLSARILSGELKKMEELGLIERIVHNTYPVTIEYHVTDFGLSLSPVFPAMVKWGMENMYKNKK